MCTDAGPDSLNGPVFYWMSRCSERKVYSSHARARSFLALSSYRQLCPPAGGEGERGGQARPGKAGQGDSSLNKGSTGGGALLAPTRGGG